MIEPSESEKIEMIEEPHTAIIVILLGLEVDKMFGVPWIVPFCTHNNGGKVLYPDGAFKQHFAGAVSPGFKFCFECFLPSQKGI